MKKNLLLVLCAIALVFASCKKKESAESSIEVSPAQLEFSVGGGTLSVTVTTDLSWTAEVSGSELFTILRNSGTGSGTIAVEATPNLEPAVKNGTLKISASNGIQKEVALSIVAADARLATSPVSMNFDLKGGSKELTIKSNTSWKISTSETWIKPQTTSGTGDATVTIDVDPTDDEGTLTGTVEISTDEVSKTLTITRTGVVLKVTSEGETAKMGRTGRYHLNLECNTDWSASVYGTDILLPVSLSKTSGSGNDNLDIVSLPPAYSVSFRTGKVVFKAGKVTKSVNIAQYISVTDCEKNTYYTTGVNGQIWMAENLRCSTFDTDSEYAGKKLEFYNPQGSSPSTYNYYTTPKTKSYWKSSDDAEALTDELLDKLGYLYSWQGAVNMGICPNGWHIPSKIECEALLVAVGGKKTSDTEYAGAGAMLKNDAGWHNGGNGTNLYGFSALPAGFSSSALISIYSVGSYAQFHTHSGATLMGFSSSSNNVSIESGGNSMSSVRCVMD